MRGVICMFDLDEINVMEYEFTYPVNRLLGIYTYEGAL